MNLESGRITLVITRRLEIVASLVQGLVLVVVLRSPAGYSPKLTCGVRVIGSGTSVQEAAHGMGRYILVYNVALNKY